MATLYFSVDEILAALRQHGKRITEPKRSVAEVLVSAADHVTADEVNVRVQMRRPYVAPSTVYRILEEFEELGIVEHSHSGHAAAVYHLVGGNHGHVTCQVCHVTYEVPAGLFDRLADQLQEATGFALDRHHVALSGICATCRNAS